MEITISAIIPAYNAERFLQETIDSLLAQARLPEEIIVVNDGSTDKTSEIADAAARNHDIIRTIHQENAGGARARLAGYDAATSDYLYFIDADDVATPDALERLAGAMQTYPDSTMCYGNAAIVDASLSPLTTPQEIARPSGHILMAQLMANQIITVGCALIRKSALHRAAMDHTLQIGQDLVMWAQLASAGPCYFVAGAPLLYYRKHPMNVTRQNLENPSRYFEYIDWILQYEPILSKLSDTQIGQVKRRRTTAAHSFIAKTASLVGEYALARQHAFQAITLEPLNWKLYALYFFARLGAAPSFVKARLFS